MAIHCFYHSADLDGHCSGAIVKYKYPEAIMHPINYGDEFPWNEIEPEDKVYMVDFCLQPWTGMVQLQQFVGGDLYWIDHHLSAIGEYTKDVESCIKAHSCGYELLGLRDTSKAACELTWKYLFPDKPVPLAVKLLSLYDSWTYQGHELEPMVLPFQMRMRLEPLDPREWSRNKILWGKLFYYVRHNVTFERYLQEGELLLRYDEEQKRRYVQAYGFETRLLHSIGNNCGREIMADMGLRCIAVNLGHTNSKVFDSVWRKECWACNSIPRPNDKCESCPVCNGTGYIEPYDLMITFCRRSDHKWNVSLYSTKSDIDCGAIAKSFGGGGHKGAAGFQCTELPFEH